MEQLGFDIRLHYYLIGSVVDFKIFLTARLLSGGLGSSLLHHVQMEHCPDTLDEVFEDDDEHSNHTKGMVVE